MPPPGWPWLGGGEVVVVVAVVVGVVEVVVPEPLAEAPPVLDELFESEEVDPDGGSTVSTVVVVVVPVVVVGVVVVGVVVVGVVDVVVAATPAALAGL